MESYKTKGFEENKRITLSQRKKSSLTTINIFQSKSPKVYLHSLFEFRRNKERSSRNFKKYKKRNEEDWCKRRIYRIIIK